MLRALVIAVAVSAAAGITLAASDALAFGVIDEGIGAFGAAVPVTLVRHGRSPKRLSGAIGSVGNERLGGTLVIPRGYDGLGAGYSSLGSQRGGWYNRGWGGTSGGPGWGYGFGPNLGGSELNNTFH